MANDEEIEGYDDFELIEPDPEDPVEFIEPDPEPDESEPLDDGGNYGETPDMTDGSWRDGV
jgi:hypothetical protein